MAYVDASAPLPQNSAMPVPRAELEASDRRRMAAFMASRTGRERVYANLPTAAELWNVSHGLAADANQIIGQSEVSRQSVLIGMGLPYDLSDAATDSIDMVAAAAPVVVSLNGDNAVGSGATQNGTMPAAAPVWDPSVGLYREGPKTGANKRRNTHFEVKQQLAEMGIAQVSSTQSIGPGCRAVSAIPKGSQSQTTLPLPQPAPNPPSPQPVTAVRTQIVHLVPTPTANYPEHATVIDDPTPSGPVVQFEKASYAGPYYAAQGIQVSGTGLSGIGPEWGGAGVEVPAGGGPGGGLSVWWLIFGALGAVGVTGYLDKRGRR